MRAGPTLVGIWGGMTAPERLRLRHQRRMAQRVDEEDAEPMELTAVDLDPDPEPPTTGSNSEPRCTECGAVLPTPTTVAGRPRKLCGNPACKRSRDQKRRRAAGPRKRRAPRTEDHPRPVAVAAPELLQRPSDVLSVIGELLVSTGAERLRLDLPALSITVAARSDP
jgi:hypothetical protein